jgi:hypothetical protein
VEASVDALTILKMHCCCQRTKKRGSALIWFWWFLYSLGWDCWNEVADTLPETELRNLVRDLTAAELELHWSGGSVASVI